MTLDRASEVSSATRFLMDGNPSHHGDIAAAWTAREATALVRAWFRARVGELAFERGGVVEIDRRHYAQQLDGALVADWETRSRARRAYLERLNLEPFEGERLQVGVDRKTILRATRAADLFEIALALLEQIDRDGHFEPRRMRAQRAQEEAA